MVEALLRYPLYKMSVLTHDTRYQLEFGFGRVMSLSRLINISPFFIFAIITKGFAVDFKIKNEK